jgi:hypothetical protein
MCDSQIEITDQIENAGVDNRSLFDQTTGDHRREPSAISEELDSHCISIHITIPSKHSPNLKPPTPSHQNKNSRLGKYINNPHPFQFQNGTPKGNTTVKEKEKQRQYLDYVHGSI